MKIFYCILIGLISFVACREKEDSKITTTRSPYSNYQDTSFEKKLSNASLSLTTQHVRYDPTYFSIPYPNGDVPSDKGVCCDVIIRAYRKMGIDLQRQVHEDMVSSFSTYPKKWHLRATDPNIDHRRVPNLMTFFARHHAALPITQDPLDYQPGDVICWMLPHDLTHIGIVIDSMNANSQRNLIVHNIGSGQVVSDCLFSYKIIGHYRYHG